MEATFHHGDSPTNPSLYEVVAQAMAKPTGFADAMCSLEETEAGSPTPHLDIRAWTCTPAEALGKGFSEFPKPMSKQKFNHNLPRTGTKPVFCGGWPFGEENFLR